MYQVKDKVGTPINIKDAVSYEKMQEDMFKDGEVKKVDGIVIAILSETEVQVQPEEGASDTVMCDHLLVTESLINDVVALTDMDSMNKLMLDAEKRYADECDKNGTAKKGGGTRAPAKKKAQGTMKL